ncbi:MAG: tartrate-resistant acid phosphatase type 5 [Myxococcota bacterium]|jgi:tartrate-resistant acid phosphatase type 5
MYAFFLLIVACNTPKPSEGADTSAPSTTPTTTSPAGTGAGTGGATGTATGGGTATGTATGGTGTGTGTGTATGGTATGTGTSTGTATGTGAGTGTGTGSTTPGPAPIVRFIALGDAGEGNDSQYQVGQAIGEVCAARGCDFALYLGDNFYDSGVEGVFDDQWQDKFELPYEHLEFPFYPALGNHDLGLEGLGVEFWLSPIYVNYTDYSTKWTMPNEHYAFEAGHVKFIALDTTRLFFSFTDQQAAFWAEEMATLSPGIEHVIAFGHHPYVSNGQHGNAGNYEGLPGGLPLAEIPRGDYIRDFFDENICGQALVYLSGHDHNRQWIEPTCGTEFIVSGAGAKTTDLVGRGNTTFFEDDTEEGFLWVEFEGNRFTGAFYDLNGELDYEQTFEL